MTFNEAQKQAIVHKDGPMLVLAGPGSGKTMVLTHRVQHLIEQHGIHPAKILVITFTKAAALEMKERFYKLAGENLPVVFGTFHSIFFTILKQAYGYTSANVVSEEEKRQYLREIVARQKLEMEDEAEFLSNLIGEISLVKGEMLSLEHYYSATCSDDVFRTIYESYEEYLRLYHKIDFDDMMVFTYELFLQREDILEQWQKRFPYILIDEFQDINKLQYNIVKMLAKPNHNLFIVGDDDQSIYRFRGANPEIMLGFEKDYPNCKKTLLSVNYRCSEDIVNGAKRVIKNNTKRFPKDIQSSRGKKHPIQVHEVLNQRKENEQILNLIREYNRKGILFSEMAIIFRTNTQPRLLLEKLLEYNIPFKMRDGIPNIYEHFIARNLMNYMRLAVGNRERVVFLDIMNRPKRYLSRDYLVNPVISFAELKMAVADKGWMVDRIVQLESDLKMIAKMSPYAAINYIRKGIGYDEFLREYANFRKMNVEDLFEVIDEIQTSAKEHATMEDWFKHIREYSEQLKEQMSLSKKDREGVTLTTMHSSKGLEYQVVFLLDVNEEVTPHKKAVKDADLEEERRMFYVAMTRAKDYLHIFTVEDYFTKKLPRSRFLGELLFDKEELAVGAIVEHKKYGIGKITYIDQDRICVYFDKLDDTRTLNVEFVIANGLLTLKQS
ncbi:MAG: ATP-dependent helicase [Firmicutes bacterium]|uniref:DNA 3'-5' helicase n=1 Tax=Candidatus Scybalomonas excrementavium TaxID=2840943 RepID=A0A9D9N836_9FIRM|nr:ATP-dependent helicase [Candidatus Scybalomonas excrementavium]